MALDAYALEEVVGRGGMAIVYRARVREGPRAGRDVAVKRLHPKLARDPEQVALFLREAALAAQLHHPGIVEVLETGSEGGVPYIVMEYVDGLDLKRFVAACNARGLRLPPDFALHAAHAVAQALRAAHEARSPEGSALGVVHCDVSPSNVFASREGALKLGDFGVARAVGEGPRRVAMGKVRYLAPEQLRGEAVGPRTDVFGLGAVLFELLTGKPAFPGQQADEVVASILTGARRPPSAERPDLSPEVDALVLRALAVEDRYPDAGAFAAALAERYDPGVGNPLALAAVLRAVS